MSAVLAYRDLVPAELRAQWTREGRYPRRDVFTLFGEQAAARSSEIAVVDGEGVVDYATLHAAASRVAGALVHAGIRRGEVVAIQVPNGWRACAVELGVAATGAIALPYPFGRGERDTRSLLGRSRAAIAVAGVAAGAVDPPSVLTKLRGETLPHLREVFVVGGCAPGCRSLDGVLAGDEAEPWSPGPIDPDHPARILVSSGSESEPKMVLYSHNALVGGRGRLVGGLRTEGQPFRSLYLVPLGSSFGSWATMVTLARYGGTLLLQRAFDAGEALGMIDEHRPTHAFGVGTMFKRMLAHARSRQIDTSSLLTIVSGGSRIDHATVQACRERFSCAFQNIYGSADGVGCLSDPDYPPTLTSESVGRPDPAIAAVRITDEDGADVPVGHEGEILSRGPMSPLCYVNSPELDARYRTATGWVRTGDRGRFDASGRLYVVGRIKEIVIRGGYNISPVEIEQLLHVHPGVQEVACVGIDDVELGERVCACVVARRPANPPTLDELNAFLEQQGLERKKLPERLEILDELPISPAGKVSKQILRERFATTGLPA